MRSSHRAKVPTYGMARVLLAGDAEIREEEYMVNGPYTGPLTPHHHPQGSEVQKFLSYDSAPC